MSEEELIEFLKKNLKLDVDTHQDPIYIGGDMVYQKSYTVRLDLAGSTISEIYLS